VLWTVRSLVVDGWTVRDFCRCLRTMYVMTSPLSSSSRQFKSLTSHVCRVPYYTRTWYELCCQRFEAYTLNDVGKTLCRQLDSFKTKIINILSLRHLKTFHATFYKSSTFTGFITKYLYLNHGLKKQRSLVNDIISSPLCACMYLYLIFPAYELSIQDN